jgi:hypothetical protein
MEMVDGAYAHAHGKNNFNYALLTNGEEFLELLGLSLFIPTLIDYIKNHLGVTAFRMTLDS